MVIGHLRVILGATRTWSVATDLFFRYFRIWQTGVNSNNNHYLALSGLELYGTVKDASYRPAPIPVDIAERSPASPVKVHVPVEEVKIGLEDGMEFKHNQDMDMNGVLYFLGSLGKTSQWMNPQDRGLVYTSSSPLIPDSAPCSALVGREAVRCVTQSSKDNFFMVDLLSYWVSVTAYTLRHYSSWNTEALREWKFQGSNDGEKWHKIVSHKNDESLFGKGATHTWTLAKPKKRYRMFRILQTGQNSNGHWCLALSGLELYGQVFTSPK